VILGLLLNCARSHAQIVRLADTGIADDPFFWMSFDHIL
jgi:hypothetical protein